ncbi:MAG: DnaJ family domain-containing protein [Desulfovibrio sp.]|uniref:DnaJ family domain-containing protein n=1 Tax=Desulfovibrio sp. 7SRBS1 TaxID=3378064 RepID=UPI003B3E3DF7
MFEFIAQAAEKHIREAMDNGEFDNLNGSGKPLKLEDDSNVPQDLRMAYKVLRNSGYVPEEVQNRKEISTALELLENAPDEKERYRQMQKLNYLMLKLNISRGSNSNLDADNDYYRKILDRIAQSQK